MLERVLTLEECRTIGDPIRVKIESFLSTTTEKFTEINAVYQSLKREYDELSKTFEEKLSTEKQKCNSYLTSLSVQSNHVNELEDRISHLGNENNELKEELLKCKDEQEKFGKERDEALDRLITLEALITKLQKEQEDLKIERDSLKGLINTEVDLKTKIANDAAEIERLTISLSSKGKSMQDVKTKYESTIASLTKEVADYSERIVAVKNEWGHDIACMSSQLQEKEKQVNSLMQEKNALEQQTSYLLEQMKDVEKELTDGRSLKGNLEELYQKELERKQNLVNMYKTVSEEAEKKVGELLESETKLKGKLSEMSDMIEELRQNCEKMERERSEERHCHVSRIEALEFELKKANEIIDLQKTENTREALESISPYAAAAYNMIQSGMSLTQMYTQYSKLTEQLAIKTKENEQLDNYIQQILKELEAKVPILRKKQEDYEQAMATAAQISEKYDSLETEHISVVKTLDATRKDSAFIHRENQRIKRTISDLSKQVCFLLKKIEEMRGNDLDSVDYNERTYSDLLLTSDEIIGQKLVTFRDIKELQKNNVKLLVAIREISATNEAAEKEAMSCSREEWEYRIAALESTLKEKTEAMDRQQRIIAMLKAQLRLLNMMYSHQAAGKSVSHHNAIQLAFKSVGINDDTEEMEIDFGKPEYELCNSESQTDTVAEENKQIVQLTQERNVIRKKYDEIAAEYNQYRQEKDKNERMLRSSLEEADQKVYNLTMELIKSSSALDSRNEQMSNAVETKAVLKAQVTSLEEKCAMYEDNIAKAEQQLSKLKNEMVINSEKMTNMEIELFDLRKENAVLKDRKVILEKENNMLMEQQSSQGQVLASLELIRDSLSRSSDNSKQQLERQLDTSLKECAALRRQLQNERDNYNKRNEHLLETMQTVQNRLEEEKKETERLKEQIQSLEKLINDKDKYIDSLRQQLSCSSSSSVYELEMKITYLQKELTAKTSELDSAKEMLNMSKIDAKEMLDLSEKFEKQLIAETAKFQKQKGEWEAKVSELAGEAAGLRQQNKKLAARVAELDGLKETSMESLSDELKNLENRYSKGLEEVGNLKQELASVKAELKEAVTAKLEAEKRYADEISRHATNMRVLQRQATRVAELEEKVAELASEKNLVSEKANVKHEDTSRDAEYENQLEKMHDLITQNETLMKQIHELTEKLAASSTPSDKAVSEVTNVNSSSSDQALSREECVKVIARLRQERNLSLTELEALKAEKARLDSQVVLLNSQLDAVQNLLNAERNKNEVTNQAATRYAEIKQQVGTFEAIMESNQMLRDEKRKFEVELTELREKLTRVEDQTITPLKEENKLLSKQLENVSDMHEKLQKECSRWRARVTELSEKIAKNNYEELQKCLTLERENHNKTLEDLRAVKQEKSRLEDQIKRLQTASTERVTLLEKELIEVQKELEESKANNEKVTKECEELKKTLESTETSLTSMKNSYLQMKQIARKYKIQNADLAEKLEEEKKKSESDVAAKTEPTAATAGQERPKPAEVETTDRIKQLTDEVAEKQKALDTLQEEFNQFKESSEEKLNRYQKFAQNARGRVATLTVENKKLQAETDTYKEQVEKIESATRDESVARENVIKSSYENRISKLEKEKNDIQSERERLAKENEVLSQRISALQRNQQGMKPSTSGQEKSTAEPPTANIKPMAGPSSSVPKLPVMQQSVTVTPWRSTPSLNEPPLASIKPMSMQSRTVAVLPTSQTVSQSAVLVSPQQQLVDTSSNATSVVEAFSSPSSSSHIDYSIPSTSSVVSHAVRQMVVTPTQQAAYSAESTQQLQTVATQQTQLQANVVPGLPQVISISQPSQAPTVALVLPRIETQGTVQTPVQHLSVIEQSVASSQPVAAAISESGQADQPNVASRAEAFYTTENEVTNQGQVSASSQQIIGQIQSIASSNEMAVGQSSVASSQQAPMSSSSENESINLFESVTTVSSIPGTSNNTVTTSGGKTLKRQREGEPSKSSEVCEDRESQVKRTRVLSPRESAEESSGVVEVEYQVPTSSQRDQEFDNLLVDSDAEGDELEDEQTMPDDGIIDDGIDNPDFEDDVENDERYELHPYDRDDQDTDEGPFVVIEGPDLDDDASNQVQGDEDNEAEIMDGEGEVPNPMEGNEDSSGSGVVRSSTDQQNSEATSSGNNTLHAESTNMAAGGILDNQFGRIAPPISRQQTQQLVLSQGYEDIPGDDSIVPSTPTLFVPRRSDGFSEAVSSPQVPSGGRFTFSESNAPTTRAGLAQIVTEGIDDTRMDLSQLEERTGRSVPNTPVHVSAEGEIGEVGQSEDGARVIDDADTLDAIQIEQPQDILEEIVDIDEGGSSSLVEEVVGSPEVENVTSEQPPNADEGREAEAAVAADSESHSSEAQQISTVGTAARQSARVRTRGGTRGRGSPQQAIPTRTTTNTVGRGTRTSDMQRRMHRGGRGRYGRTWGYARY